MQWRTESRKAPATGQPPAATLAPITGTTGQQPPIKEIDPATTEASQGYPDKAILNLTVLRSSRQPLIFIMRQARWPRQQPEPQRR